MAEGKGAGVRDGKDIHQFRRSEAGCIPEIEKT